MVESDKASKASKGSKAAVKAVDDDNDTMPGKKEMASAIALNKAELQDRYMYWQSMLLYSPQNRPGRITVQYSMYASFATSHAPLVACKMCCNALRLPVPVYVCWGWAI